MRHQEKKYRVDDFAGIQSKLETVGAKKGTETTTTHFYAQQAGNDVTKLVSYNDRDEIHLLEESDGKFTLKEKILMASKEAGLRWLKDKGFTKADVVKMANTDYDYEDGIVGLYVINDFLHSVILDFPSQRHGKVEQEFDLSNQEVINVPYNKYLQQIGKGQSVGL